MIRKTLNKMIGAGFLVTGSASSYFLADSIANENIGLASKATVYVVALAIPVYTALEGGGGYELSYRK